jgi:hypothetical protein
MLSEVESKSGIKDSIQKSSYRSDLVKLEAPAQEENEVKK